MTRGTSGGGDAGQRRPTLADVGRRVGVSGAAVSYVLNGRGDGQVAPSTADRILRAAEELGYRPNRAARALRTRRRGIVGLVLGEAHNNNPPVGVMAGAHDEAQAADCSLLVTNTPGTRSGIRQAVDEVLEHQVDGIVVAVAGPRRIPVPTVPGGTPVLLVNAIPTPAGTPCVLPDELAGGRAATAHLIEHGHRRVGFLAGARGMWATGARVRGHRVALADAGVALDDDLVCYGTYRIRSGHELARQLLAVHPRPTALLCGNDRMALGALLAAAETGLRVPQDVSVMGYDDEPEIAADAVPALTTVRLPYSQMGSWAVRRVLDGGTDQLPARTLLACEVVARASVGPVSTRSPVSSRQRAHG